jgi:hypothetical protein
MSRRAAHRGPWRGGGELGWSSAQPEPLDLVYKGPTTGGLGLETLIAQPLPPLAASTTAPRIPPLTCLSTTTAPKSSHSMAGSPSSTASPCFSRLRLGLHLTVARGAVQGRPGRVVPSQDDPTEARAAVGRYHGVGTRGSGSRKWWWRGQFRLGVDHRCRCAGARCVVVVQVGLHGARPWYPEAQSSAAQGASRGRSFLQRASVCMAGFLASMMARRSGSVSTSTRVTDVARRCRRHMVLLPMARPCRGSTRSIRGRGSRW